MSSMPNPQPVLPPEGTYTDAEQLFISEEPRNLFPTNQNSNWGLVRKVLAGQSQLVTNILNDLYSQAFIRTALGADGYLGAWEVQVDIPRAPTGYSDAQRRKWVEIAANRAGVFTTKRLRDVIESYLTIGGGGAATQLLPPGVVVDPAGFTLYGEGGSVTSQYRIYYNPRNFSYTIWITSTITPPDMVTLQRKLLDLTPAGMSFTIDNSHTAIVHYGNTILNKQPTAYFRLSGLDYTDASGNGMNGSAAGGISAVAVPGLLTAGKADDQPAVQFNGTTGFFSFADGVLFNTGDIFSIEFWMKPNSLSGSQVIIDRDNGWRVNFNTGALSLSYGNNPILSCSQTFVVGTTYHVVIRKSGSKGSIKVNNVEKGQVVATTPFPSLAPGFPIHVARQVVPAQSYYNGSLDELAIYPRYLTDAEVLENYNAGKNINP